MIEMKQIDELGQEALKIARKTILSYYGSDVGVEWKADATPVTIADQLSEELMRKFLAKEMNCGFIGEELGIESLDRDYTWVLDPIDGTKSFVRDVPLFGTLLACLYKGEPIWGAIDIHAQQKRLTASKGGGCHLNGRLISVSQESKNEKSCLLTGTVNTFEEMGQAHNFHTLRKDFGLYRGWGDCFGYFQVLTGKAEVMLDPVVSLWDIAPMKVLFEEAGGRFTDLNGLDFSEMVPDIKKWEFASDEFTGLGTNKLWHNKVLARF